MADLKAVYAAVDEQAALDALEAFSERWDKKYPKISQSWRANWANLETSFQVPSGSSAVNLYHQRCRNRSLPIPTMHCERRWNPTRPV